VKNVPVLIEGVRLRLRRSAPADAGETFRIASDPEVMAYLEWPAHRSPAEATAYLQGCVARWDAGTEYHWAIVEKAGEHVLGSIACRVQGHAADFGCLLAREAWGRGFGTEAVSLLVGWLQRQPEILRIWATTDVDNVRAARVLAKAGLQQEGVMRLATRRPQQGGLPRDTRLFAWVREVVGEGGKGGKGGEGGQGEAGGADGAGGAAGRPSGVASGAASGAGAGAATSIRRPR
jgi:RimJ/RimL family protein N-acetyltransferase